MAGSYRLVLTLGADSTLCPRCVEGIDINDFADTNWYGLSVEETFERLDADENGLSSEEAASRLAQHGPNELIMTKPSAFRFERLDEIPFDSANMYMATLHRVPDGTIIFAKCSPERLLPLCSQQRTPAALEPVEPRAVLARVEDMAHDSLRVLAMASKTQPAGKTTLTPEDLADMTFLGLQAMIDPPRPAAVVAVALNEKAGVRTIMITGDHVVTARAIAKQLGILKGDDRLAVIGEELSCMSPAELAETVDEVSVYARVAPEHKLQICHQLQRAGNVVAMTGDGVNDAPALNAADIGVSMGVTGTEVSKEASEMVLTDDNFASVVAAVEEGRHAWNNIEKAILYTLPTNGGQALLGPQNWPPEGL